MGNTLLTRWGKTIDPEHVLEDYPRPGMRRDSFICLNGFWTMPSQSHLSSRNSMTAGSWYRFHRRQCFPG